MEENNDPNKCLVRVLEEGPWLRAHQCRRPLWKDGYCKIHHPESVEARNKKLRERYEEKKRNEPWFILSEIRENNTEAKALEFISNKDKEMRGVSWSNGSVELSKVLVEYVKSLVNGGAK